MKISHEIQEEISQTNSMAEKALEFRSQGAEIYQ
jgi:hypothetical protein